MLFLLFYHQESYSVPKVCRSWSHTNGSGQCASTIEKKCKEHEHCVPADDLRIIREVKTKPSPYSIESLNFGYFFSYADGLYKSIKPG